MAYFWGDGVLSGVMSRSLSRVFGVEVADLSIKGFFDLGYETGGRPRRSIFTRSIDTVSCLHSISIVTVDGVANTKGERIDGFRQ